MSDSDPMGIEGRDTTRPRWLRRLFGLAMVASVIAIALLFYQNRQTFLGFAWNVRWFWFSWALILSWVTWLLMGHNWGVVSHRLGSALRPFLSLYLYLLSNVAQFVPGRVWQLASRIYVYGQEGMGKRVTSVALILETVLLVLSGLVVLLVSAIFSPVSWLSSIDWRLLFLLVPVLLISAYPRLLVGGVNRLLSWLRRPPLLVELNYLDTLKWMTLYSLNWVLGGLALYCVFRALGDIQEGSLIQVIQGFCISGVLSQVVFFLPAGLGLRELSLVFLLSPTIPKPIVLVGALIFRVMTVLAEASLLLGVEVYRRHHG